MWRTNILSVYYAQYIQQEPNSVLVLGALEHPPVSEKRNKRLPPLPVEAAYSTFVVFQGKDIESHPPPSYVQIHFQLVIGLGQSQVR